MRTLFVAEDHGSIYDVWRSEGASGLRLLHVDDHCDMCGLLVDRRRGLAAATSDRLLREGVVYGGNFLAHAVLEGRVSGVRWVHGRSGGRERDVGTVKYLTDPSALPYRFGWRRADYRPFDYSVMRIEQWAGRLREGEHLDVDWDCFASRRASRAGVAERARAFLASPFEHSPPAIYLAYSPPYSHPTQDLFDEFTEALARRFDARVERLPSPERGGRPSWIKRLRWRAAQAVRERGLL